MYLKLRGKNLVISQVATIITTVFNRTYAAFWLIKRATRDKQRERERVREDPERQQIERVCNPDVVYCIVVGTFFPCNAVPLCPECANLYCPV